jgi:outer membrane protein
MTRRAIWPVALLCVALTAPVDAQQPPPSVPQSLSLADAVALARGYNPLLRQYHNNRAGAAWGVRTAYGAFLPRLDLSGGIGYQRAGTQAFLAEQFTLSSSTIGSSYSLRFSMGLSGRSLLQPGVARAQAEATEATILGAEVNLESSVRRQYLIVLQRIAQVDLAELQLRRAEEFLRLAQARFEVGQNTMLDVRQAEVARGQAEVALIQARQAVTVEKLRMFQTIGVPAPADPSVVVLTDTFPVVAPEWQLEDLLTEADGANPDLTSLRANSSAAQASARAAKSTWLPTLSFSAGWSGYTQQFTNLDPIVQGGILSAQANAATAVAGCDHANQKWLNPGSIPDDCSLVAYDPAYDEVIRSSLEERYSGFPFSFTRQPFSASLSISLPLFTQFTRPLQVAEAGALAEDAREAVRARELQVRTDVSQAYYTLVTAHETIGIQESNRTAAGEQLRLATERYRVGSGTFFELLDAQVAAQRAEADYVNAIYLYHQAIAALEAAVGRPLR